MAGQFAAGTVNTYIGKEPAGFVGGSFSGNSQVLIIGVTAYSFYTVPVADRQYIRIMTADKETIERLEAFSMGKGEAVYFEGEIVKAPIEINRPWYKGIEEIESLASVVSTEKAEDKPKTFISAKSYNRLNELEAEKKRLEGFYRKQRQMKKGCLYRLPLEFILYVQITFGI